MKKFAFVVIIMIAVLLTGCADVRYRRIFDKSGIIIDEVIISIDKDAVDSNDAETIYQEVKHDFGNYKNAIDEWIKTNFGGMYIEDESVEQYIREGIIATIIEKKETDKSYDFGFVMQFNTIEHFVYFYGLHNCEDYDVVTNLGLNRFEGVKGFDIADFGPFVSQNVTNDYTKSETPIFTTGYIWTSDNVYDNFKLMNKTDDMTYLYYYCGRVSTITDNAYTVDEVSKHIDIIEIFETNDSRLFGNSDKSYKDANLSGFTVYEWNISDDLDREIEIQRNLPKSSNWIGLAIILSLILIGILFVVYLLKYRNKNVLEENDGQE